MVENDPFLKSGMFGTEGTVTQPQAAPTTAAPPATPASPPPAAAPGTFPEPAASEPPAEPSKGNSFHTPPPAEPSEPGLAEPAPVDPAAEPGADPAPAAPTIDFSIIGEGKFQSVDEVNTYINDLKEKAAVADKNPFANEYVEKLNEAIREGIDPGLYSTIADLDFDKMEAREALIIEQMWKNKLSEEDAELLVDSKYKLGSDDDTENQEVKLARIQAKSDANSAKEFLQGFKADALTPPAERIAAEQTQAWEPHIPKVLNEFKKVTIEGKTGSYNFDVSPETLQSAQELLSEVIASGYEVPPDSEGMEFAKAVVFKEVISKELSRMVDQVADHYRNLDVTEKHNPRVAGGSTTPPPANSEAGVADFLAGIRGFKLNNQS